MARRPVDAATVGLSGKAPSRPRGRCHDGAEEFRAFDLLVRYEVGSDFFLAPGLGLQARWWSGDDPAEEWDVGPVASLAAGTYLDTGSSWVVIPEVFADLSLIELEGDVTTGRAGLRFSFVRVGPS